MSQAQPMIASAVKKAFHNWAKRDVKYKRVYKRLPKEALGIVESAIDDMTEFKPAYFNHWYVGNHMRYVKGQVVRQEDITIIQELAYNFFTLYARGKLSETTRPTKKERAQTA